MKTQNRIKLKQIFMEIFSINESEVESLKMINNRKWDSLASVMLIAAIESEFDVLMEESDYESFSSLATVEQALDKLGL
jgi:acyl carrier protein